MSAFDGNHDGRLSNAERSDAREFDRGDKNNDGALNRAEFARVDSTWLEVPDEQPAQIALTIFS